MAGLAGIAIGPSLASYVAAVLTPVDMLWVAVAAIAGSVALHLSLRGRALDNAPPEPVAGPAPGDKQRRKVYAARDEAVAAER
ncbi:MAG: hypothetical protein AcusKO_15730 [Acuticoccus sp.]